MGGEVKVESEVGVGTTFSISLTMLCKVNEEDLAKPQQRESELTVEDIDPSSKRRLSELDPKNKQKSQFFKDSDKSSSEDDSHDSRQSQREERKEPLSDYDDSESLSVKSHNSAHAMKLLIEKQIATLRGNDLIVETPSFNLGSRKAEPLTSTTSKKRKLKDTKKSKSLYVKVREAQIEKLEAQLTAIKLLERIQEMKEEKERAERRRWSVSDLRVLIVNDEIITVMILETMLTKQLKIPTENVDRASNGLEAYEKAKCGHFDLVIMDLTMPIMDGFKATAKIKDYFDSSNLFMNGDTFEAEKENGGAPYIVALSASTLDSSLLSKCKRARFDDQFSSPLDLNTLKNEVVDEILLKKNLSVLSPMVVEEDSLVDKEEQLKQELVKCGLIEPETVFDIDDKNASCESSPRASSLKLPERAIRKESDIVVPSKKVRFADQ